MLLNAGLNAWISDMDGLEVTHGLPYTTKYFAHGQSADVYLKVGKAYKTRLRKSRGNHGPAHIHVTQRLLMQGGPRDGVALGTCYLDEKQLTEPHGTAIPLIHNSNQWIAQGSIKMAHELYGGFIVVVIRESKTGENGVFTKTTSGRTPPLASFRFWFSKSANNSMPTQQTSQNHPPCQSSVNHSAPSRLMIKREATTNSHHTKRIDRHEPESDLNGRYGGYDNRKQRSSGLGTDAIVVHNRPHNHSELITSKRKKSHVWSAAKRWRMEVTNETFSNDVIGTPEEENSNEFSDTALSISESVTRQTLSEATVELRRWKILAEKAEVDALRNKIKQFKAEIRYYKKKVREIAERSNV